jgi:hypothetical protein
VTAKNDDATYRPNKVAISVAAPHRALRPTQGYLNAGLAKTLRDQPSIVLNDSIGLSAKVPANRSERARESSKRLCFITRKK